MKKPIVAIVMGSASDRDTMAEAGKILSEFDIVFEARIMSAHRTPDLVKDYVSGLSDRKFKVIIAGAGKAAHLPGVAASFTCLPVIGVPMETRDLGGLDSLLSMVQMPPGIPVGTVGIGKAGARNAGLLAVAILAASDRLLYSKLERYRAVMANGVSEADELLQGDDWIK
ncbi:MAG: 5-(carboxyamino)imidazole ribonucleotide mutase [Lentisphaerae bacterium]|nr:5-(carboxyamino)imidazole ribonucleotide mutase [Lentisphaerota bacterium]